MNHKQVYTAESAVAACAQNKYELIVMDLDTEWQSSIVATGLAVRISSLNVVPPEVTTPTTVHVMEWLHVVGCRL